LGAARRREGERALALVVVRAEEPIAVVTGQCQPVRKHLGFAELRRIDLELRLFSYTEILAVLVVTAQEAETEEPAHGVTLARISLNCFGTEVWAIVGRCLSRMRSAS